MLAEAWEAVSEKPHFSQPTREMGHPAPGQRGLERATCRRLGYFMTMSARSSSLRLQRFSFRFAEQVLNSKLSLKEEIDTILPDTIPDITKMSRPVSTGCC